MVDGINVHAVRIPYANDMTFRQRMRAFFRFAIRAYRYASRLEYDVVFATSTPLTIAMPGMRLARRARVPFVFEVRDLWPDIPIAVGALKNRLAIAAARRLEVSAYDRAAAIVVLSPDMRDALLKRDIPDDKIVVIPNGCDLYLFPDRTGLIDELDDEGDDNDDQQQTTNDKRATTNDKRAAGEARERPGAQRAPNDRPLDRFILYAGTIGLANDVSYLVDIAAEMKALESNIRFAVFGSGAKEREVRAQAQNAGVLDETLFFFPPVPKSEMPSVFEAADMALCLFAPYPGMGANSANKFFDALAAGVAVGINYPGWQAELLEETGAGIVLPERDARASAEKIDAFFRDPEAVRRAGRQARILAETRFDRDRQAQQLIDLLETVVGARY